MSRWPISDLYLSSLYMNYKIYLSGSFCKFTVWTGFPVIKLHVLRVLSRPTERARTPVG